MEVAALSRPCILLETVELLTAAVNDAAAGSLTANGPYCIPEEAVRQIMDRACEGLDLRDPALLRFFRLWPLEDRSGDLTCLARSLAYLRMDFTCRGLAESMASLRDTWRDYLAAEEYPVRIGRYSMDCIRVENGAGRTLEARVMALHAPRAYRELLLDALEDFDRASRELETVLAPAALRLEELLAPWVERAGALAEGWREQFAQAGLSERLQRLWPPEMLREADAISCCLRYLDAQYQVTQYDNVRRRISFHVGLRYPADLEARGGFESWVLRALRLLGGPARAKILLTVRDEPLSTRELAKRLGMDLGTVSRDVRSLRDAGLLEAAADGGKGRRYTVRTQTLDALIAYLETLRRDGPN